MSKFNIAVDCTQTIKFEEFHNCCYLNGPKFLRGPEVPSFSRTKDSFPINLN